MFNVDAAIFKNPSCMGAGIVLRAHKGAFSAALVHCCQLVHRIEDPALAEAIAVKRAVSFAMEHNLRQIIVTSDCQSFTRKNELQGG